MLRCIIADSPKLMGPAPRRRTLIVLADGVAEVESSSVERVMIWD